MFLKKTFFASLITVLLTGLLVISCSIEDLVPPVDAKAPSIIGPQGGAWNVTEDDEFTLTVTANSTDGGELSYQWYKNTINSATGGETIGEDKNTLTLEKTHYTGDGDLYFYVVVTNTNNAATRTKTAPATSSVAKVTVSGNGVAMVHAQQPSITGQPQGGEWDIDDEDEFTITVTAASTDGGTISYQWHKNTTNSTTGGTEIGDDENTLTLDKEDYEVGDTLYFYVVVTNTITDNDDGGVKTSSTTSSVATVTVVEYSVTNDPVIEGLIGEWEEEYSTFTITETTLSTDSEWGGYGGTIVNHRGDGTNAGYITIQYTSNDYNSDAIDAYYVIHYENLTASSMDISGAFDMDDDTENGFVGKATQKEAERAYTTDNDCFTIHTTVTRKVIGGPVNAYHPSITSQPTSGFWNVNVNVTGTYTSLMVTANSTDGGEISYQWYKNTTNSTTGGTPIGTDSALTLAKANYTSNGTSYFYVVVKNTIADNDDGGNKTATTTSNVATVTVRGYLTDWTEGTYYPGDTVFEESMAYLSGSWDSSYDGYLVRQWSNYTSTDQSKTAENGLTVSSSNPVTYDSNKNPQTSDYVAAYLDGGGWGFSYMGLVRAINIFDKTGDPNLWGAIIIEYFEGGDPEWLSDPDGYSYQGLEPGEKPYFGMYFQAYSQDQVGMANAVDLNALSSGNPYYTEEATLQAAITKNTKANRDNFISYSVVMPQQRQ